ncbi:adenosylmethionine--8-amino-7-oxononanoate transaminase [Fluviibacter phosphoraccumulans]|uniref:Adenosylmethionine-8-amino-7-oxononanoate aminotransferase n=1 Tax=Fluviibacter phosphoraccumulans TaxID=1751046 RepID=A0A679I391_9RHOO|nr:adenosylmethionine--8-amino-7-oxononanoate transaminase [Fluviibacter phosphoraccumulans]BBU68897.1 adenosylmethionine--8-amino-7-oxononanoate aminotransferase BioA [Fluviibacter phosphoraccumulans]BBU71952.1 adenosylmethionine--8-amino-7-oxononanoate aminotransferase BioA [Fluviibacter phosphoraccumulans]BCA64803.1 adenosylmethionine--8-amino-7-oxononanoate aminotransferase BioA [Fluviibacter phosphoraccumulans]
MTANTDWLQRSLTAVWHPCTQMKHHPALPLVPVARAEGVWLEDFEGKRYLDGISSWWVNLFGHGNPRINAAITDQLSKLEHVMLAGFTHQPAIELAERLSAKTGGALGHAFFASDGASATEIALKMSFHAWQNSGQTQKQEFVCLQGSYHGETVGALSVTDIALFRDAYAPLIRNEHVHLAPSPDARFAQPGESAEDVANRAADALEQLFVARAGKIAALIIEPLVQCATGMAMHHPRYLQRARALCDQYQVHLICDEIAVGFGRTGTFFAHEQAGIRPDVLCLSKGITGGYLPLSVVLCSDTIYQAFWDDDVRRGFLHSHSYTGNPLACRAALATLDIFDKEGTLENNRRLSNVITKALQPLASHPAVRHFRHTGMIWAMDIDTAQADFSRRYFAAAMERGILVRPIGNTVYLMPPYVLSESDAEWLAGQMLSALHATLA